MNEPGNTAPSGSAEKTGKYDISLCKHELHDRLIVFERLRKNKHDFGVATVDEAVYWFNLTTVIVNLNMGFVDVYT